MPIQSTPTKSKTKLVAGLIIGVLAVVGIGVGLYFAGVLTPEEKINIDLSKLDSTKTDPYMVYKEGENGATGLRLDTQSFIDLVDSGTNPFANPQSLISPDVCNKFKEEMNVQGWKFVLSTTDPSTENSMTHFSFTYGADAEQKNKVYAMIVDKNNQEVDLKKAESLLSYPLPSPRFVYDPSYMIVKGGGEIIPLAVGETSLKAKACDLETNELTISIPEGIENFDPTKIEQEVDEIGQVTKTEISYGAYDSDFLSGVAQTQKISTDTASAEATKVDFTALYHKDSEGFIVMLISPDGGETWIPQNEQTEDKLAKLNLKQAKLSGNYYSQDHTYTFNLNNTTITDLRLIVFTQNTTKAGAKITIPEEDKTNWPFMVDSIKNAGKKYPLNKYKDTTKIIQKTLFLLPNKDAHIQGGETPNLGMQFKYPGENIVLAGYTLTATAPHYNQFVFTETGGGAPGPSFTQPKEILELPFEFIKTAKADNQALKQPDQSSYIYSIMVLPESTPILRQAAITLEGKTGFPSKGLFPGTPEATPSPALETPTPTPFLFEPTITEGQLDADFSVWHRGHNRAIVKWKFTSGVSNNIDPKNVTLKYGESENNINKGAKVYKDKNGGKYYVVLRGLKGGEFSDKNDDGYVNGRYPYYFQISAGNKTTQNKSFKTLNRLQTIAYYYTLLLDATYLSSQDEATLQKFEKLDNAISMGDKEQKIRDLEAGGLAFHYKPEGKNSQSLLGVKFTMANDRKFKEFDKKIDELQKGGIGVTEAKKQKTKKDNEKEAIRMLYRRIHDRIYDEDLGKFYDNDGVNYWLAMMDKDEIKKYYKDKGEEDVIGMNGVKFALSVSNEYQNEQFAGLGSELLAQAKGDWAYQIVLKRGADKEGLNYLIANYPTSKEMRKHLSLSSEYETRLAEIESKSGKEAAVKELYETLYGRAADNKGEEYWLSTKNSIFDLRDTFLSSNEFTKVIKE